MIVALGGDGGDELSLGIRCIAAIAGREYSRVTRSIASRSDRAVDTLLPVKTKNLSFDYKATRFVAGRNTILLRAIMFVWFLCSEEQGVC